MKRKGVTIILIVTFVAILFYGYRYVSSPVKTETAILSQLENTITVDTYVIRNEWVYHAENSGTLYNYVSEGARVGKDALISTVYRGSVDEELIRELNNIDIKIEKLSRTIEQNERFTKDNSSIENKIENIKNNIISSSVKNDASKIAEYKSALNYMVGGEKENQINEVNALVEQKRRMQAQLSGDKSDVYSAISGVFSGNVDGYENVLTPESIVKFRVGDVVMIPDNEKRPRVSNTVNANEAILKVVDNHNWYTMSVMSAQKAEQLRDKKSVLIRFEDLPGEEVSATVEYISTEESDESNVVVVLKSDQYLEGVYSMRQGKMDIIVNRYIGYEVPIHAIRTSYAKQGVMKAIGSSELFCECDIIFQDNEKGIAIVYPANEARNKLEIGDRIVLGEKVSKEE